MGIYYSGLEKFGGRIIIVIFFKLSNLWFVDDFNEQNGYRY